MAEDDCLVRPLGTEFQILIQQDCLRVPRVRPLLHQPGTACMVPANRRVAAGTGPGLHHHAPAPPARGRRGAAGDTTRIVVLNSSGEPVTVETLATDAEAALLTMEHGKPTHLSAWHATRGMLGKKSLLSSPRPRNLDCELR